MLNGGGPFGAVIVKNSNLVSYGANHVVKHSDPTDHGEVNALRPTILIPRAGLGRCDLFTSTYPCPMCCGLAIDSGITTIVYCNTKADAEHHGGFNDRCFGKKWKNSSSRCCTAGFVWYDEIPLLIQWWSVTWYCVAWLLQAIWLWTRRFAVWCLWWWPCINLIRIHGIALGKGYCSR